jgi:Domain of unknown function (DUF5658)
MKLMDDCRMTELSFTGVHGPRVFAAVLCIISLSIADAYLTLELVGRGAEELNPIMAYYLGKSPLTFFTVKYLLTCASVVLILGIKEIYLFGTRLRNEVLFAFFIFVLASVVQWQLVLLHYVDG